MLSSLHFCVCLVSVIQVQSVEGVSLVTDDLKNATKMEVSASDINNVEIFRQLLNQETLIRMTLVKNVHALMKDMVTLKQSLTVAEYGLSNLKQTTEQEIKSLKNEIKHLQQENQKLKGKTKDISNQSSDIVRNIAEIRNDQTEFERRFSEERETFEKNVSQILTDTKTEVRYLSIMLFDLNEHTKEIQNEIPGRVEEMYNNISKRLNKSLIKVETNLVASHKNQEELNNTIAAIEKGQSLMSSNVEGNVNKTVDKLKAELRQIQFEQLKLTASVSSLEVFRINFSSNSCDKKEKIGFTVGMPSASGSWAGSTLVFSTIIYNKGDGYNSNTGIFTSPTEGHFVFFLSAQSYNKKYTYFDIVHNSTSKVRTMSFVTNMGGTSFNIYQNAANMVLLHLQRGDRVYVKRNSGSGYYSQSVPIMTFSGFQIY